MENELPKKYGPYSGLKSPFYGLGMTGKCLKNSDPTQNYLNNCLLPFFSGGRNT